MASTLLAFAPVPATGNGNFTRQVKYQWAAGARRRTAIEQIENNSFVLGPPKLGSIIKLLKRACATSNGDFAAIDT